MAPPQRRIAKPARPWEYLPSLASGSFDKPYNEARTIHSMLAIVTKPKTDATRPTPIILLSAAGYIRRGISGSQGPNRNTMKRIHGVKLPDFEV
jgi:hypothetical protein